MDVPIYRVERHDHKRGWCGPYTHQRKKTSCKLRRMIRIHNNSSFHPLPPPSVLGDPVSRCGFLTLEKLEQWFEGYLDHLFRLKFVIVEYSGEIVYRDPFQVVFIPSVLDS